MVLLLHVALASYRVKSFVCYSDRMKNYPYLDDAIARVLCQRRAELEMSKKKLSEMSQISRIHITHLEEGRKKPSMYAVFCLCEALGLDPKDFVQLVQDEVRRLSAADTPKP